MLCNPNQPRRYPVSLGLSFSSLRWLIATCLWLCSSHAFGTTPVNVLMICVDDLRPELGCYDVDYIESPHIDRLAARGCVFRHHYVQAPTCGASRCAMLTGRYASGGNHALFQRAKQLAANPNSVTPSMPAWFRKHGYTTVSVGKVSHHPGGRGGERWNDDQIIEMPASWDRSLLPAGAWQDPRGWMHGLAHGEIRDDRRKPGGGIEMDVFQAIEGPDSIYPDGPSIEAALEQLKLLAADEKPFFLAVGILRPHLPFGAPAKYLEPYRDRTLPPIPHAAKPPGPTTWHRSGEFMKYDRQGRDPNQDPEFATLVRKHYAACVSYADAQVGKLLEQLQASDQNDRTIVVLWGDHGWHLGEHAVWGKHTLFDESLRSPLIIATPQTNNGATQSAHLVDAVVESIDLFPTLTDLAGLPQPEFTDGKSLRQLMPKPLSDNNSEAGQTVPSTTAHPTGNKNIAIAYHGNAQTIRTPNYRLIRHSSGQVELYDHQTAAGETVNVAEQNRDRVRQLTEQLRQRLDANR